jgi:hypothetical protein
VLFPLSYVGLAPREGFEPPTSWLTASRSASELPRNGTGDGNRTRIASLEDWNSTIELHPHAWFQAESNGRARGFRPVLFHLSYGTLGDDDRIRTGNPQRDGLVL